MADTQDPTVGNPQSEADMREMIRQLLNKVDNLEQQLASQQAIPTGTAGEAPVTSPPADSGGQADDAPDGMSQTDGFEDVTEVPEATAPTPVPTEPYVPQQQYQQQYQQPYQQQWQRPPVPDGYGYPDAYADGYAQPTAQPSQPMGTPYQGQVGQDAGYQQSYPPRQVAYQQPPQQQQVPDAPVRADNSEGSHWHGLSEANIGKYGTGLLASLLVILGVWIGAQIMWNQIPNIVKVVALLAVGVIVEGVSAVAVARSEDGSKNGFLTSLSSTGAIVSFLALAIGGMLYNLYGPSLLGLMLMAWFVIQALIARGMGSRLFYAVTYAGGAVTLILEATQVADTTNIMTCLAFSLTALVIPAIGFPDRKRNPAVPYASSVFSMIVTFAAIALVNNALMQRGVTAGESGVTLQWVMENIDIAMLALTGFLSGCAVTAGIRGLSVINDAFHVATKIAFGCVGLFLMLASATCLHWRFGIVPNAVFCLVALLILLLTDEDELRLPTAAFTAISLGHLLDGTQGIAESLIGFPVANAVPSLLVACVLPLIPQTRRSRGRMLSVLVFVALSCIPAIMDTWGIYDVSYAMPVTVLSLIACLVTFRLALSWIGMRQDEARREIDEQMLSDARTGEMWRRNMCRIEALRRLVPLGFAFLASLSLMPIIHAKGSPVPADVAPMLIAVLASLHMVSVLGFGTGWNLPSVGLTIPGTDAATDENIRAIDAYEEEGITATVRGWNLAVLLLAYAWAMMSHSSGLDGTAGTIGSIAYSVSLIVIPATLIAHAVSRRNMWAVVGATLLSHLSFLFVARLWLTGNIGLMASCLSIALALAFVVLGFKVHKSDIRMTGLVTAVLFVMKVIFVDMRGVGNTWMTTLLLVGTGILCFAISFVYNRVDRLHGEGDDEAIGDRMTGDVMMDGFADYEEDGSDGFEDYVPPTE